MEMVEFYLSKIRKLIHLDEQEVVVLRQILDQFYGEAITCDTRTQAWMAGYTEGRKHKEEADD